MTERLRGRMLPWVSTPLLLIAVVLLWKLSIAVFGISEFVLPQPERVARETAKLVSGGAVWPHVATTLTETVVGFLIALVLGVALGAVLGRIVWLERALRPLIVASQVVPKVALIPLFVVWFGFGMTSKIITAAILAFFPVMLNVLLGVRSIDAGQRDVMRSLNASRWQTFWRLEYHATLPYVLAGMEIGIVFAIIGSVVGEFLGGNKGLGFLVVEALNALQADRLFAIILVLTVLGFLLFLLVVGLKRFLIPWHESVRTTDQVSA
jgi:NitT/TauT family transport system permease protein